MLLRGMRAIWLGLVAFSLPVVVFAFEVQPMRHSLVPANGQTTGLITVKNTRSEPLPVEIIVERRIYDAAGEQTLVAAEDDFIVFPFQALIEPGTSQAFRFQYIGEQALPQEEAYTIHVREVPVNLEEGFTGLRYVYSFGAVVYIENPEAKSDLSISSVSREDSLLNIVLMNSGTSFARLTNDRITLSQGEKSIELEGEALTSILDQVVVAPNNSSLLVLNLSGLDLGAGAINVSLRETPD